jgi:hypothetical protein
VKDTCRCALCGKLIYFEDSYSPGDDAICAECDTDVTGREHPPSIPVEQRSQHTKPCAECPWRRGACKGWLGPETGYPQVYINAAHGEEIIECHLSHINECAGAAIYRANVSKRTRHGGELKLPADTTTVFASPEEFIEHHTQGLGKAKHGSDSSSPVS